MNGIHLPGPTILQSKLASRIISTRTRHRSYATGKDPLGWNFEQNVRNVEAREENVIIVSSETEISFETCQTGISNIGTLWRIEWGVSSALVKYVALFLIEPMLALWLCMCTHEKPERRHGLDQTAQTRASGSSTKWRSRQVQRNSRR